MSRSQVPAALRRRVANQAQYRCGYCQTSEEVVGTPMDVRPVACSVGLQVVLGFSVEFCAV